MAIIKMKGFNLVELSVSMALTLIVLSVLLQQYVQVKQYDDKLYASIEEVMEIYSILGLMRDRIQHAGFTPCQSLDYLKHSTDDLNKINFASLTLLPHQIVSRRMGEPFSSALTLSANRIKLMKNIQCSPGDKVVIADCEHVEVRLVKQIEQGTKGIEMELQHPLTFSYRSNLYVGPWVEERFFMKPSKLGDSLLIYQTKHSETLSIQIQNMMITHDMNKIYVSLVPKQHPPLTMQVHLRMP